MAATNKNKEEQPSDVRVTRAAKATNSQHQAALDTSLEERIDHRFSRLEHAIEAMAVAVADIPKKEKKRKRSQDEVQEKQSKRKKSKKEKKAKQAHVSIEEEQQEPAQEQQSAPLEVRETVRMEASATSNGPLPPPPQPSHPATSGHTLPLTSFNQVSDVALGHGPKLTSSIQVTDVDKQGTWSTDVLAGGALGAYANPPVPLSTKDGASTPEIQAQVRKILQSTVTQMSGCNNNKPYNFPYEYVRRGDEKKYATVNTVTLAEHVWGTLAMIKDPAISSTIKPALLEHVDEVVEDCRDYEWPTIRRLSEEIFSLVAENRLPAGWLSSGKIQLLRMSMSKTSTAKLSSTKDVSRPRPQQTSSNTANDYWKAGPPCRAYNSRDGCDHPGGHALNGKRLQHVCSYCFVNAGATFPHSEANCRNRHRERNQHF